jgi:hypothetical protein
MQRARSCRVREAPSAQARTLSRVTASDDPMRDAPDYLGDDVYIAFGRAMAQAQHFESAMGPYAFSHRASDYAPFKNDPVVGARRSIAASETSSATTGASCCA